MIVAVMMAVAAANTFEIDLDEVKGVDLWGGRKAHPAIVNPVLGSDAKNVISLRGTWDFIPRKDRVRLNYFNDWGRKQLFDDKSIPAANRKLPKKIAVPACWEAQGIGEPVEMSESWCILGDNNPKPIRHSHMGVGGYRKYVKIPSEWSGKRIWLKVGGVKSVGWFYINGKPAANVYNFCGTYKYDITDLVEAGKEAQVVVQVRNDVPSRKGLFSAMHRWGGIYRDVELEATPMQSYIDDAWVRGNFDRGEAEAHVTIGNVGANAARVRFSVDGQMAEAEITKASEQIVRLRLNNFRAWSPEKPNLYTGLVEVVSPAGQIVHSRKERFGIRKLEVRGKAFYLNNRPFYLRGFGDDHVYPITGISPADVNEHRKHLAIARQAGFNFVRLHTHTELPEYYEAADEMGIIVEAELPYYNDEPTEDQPFDPIGDVTELWQHYRRYPSFGVYSMGNEGTMGAALDRALHRYVKKMDPDRLKINQDCQLESINPPESADFLGGPIKIWKRGDFNPDRPFVTHEYMNLGAKGDARLESQFTGIWQPPVPKAKRNAYLAKFGLDDAWGDRLQDAQHALQRVWQKRGIECARTDPFCDGFCYWTIVDVTVAYNNTFSAQGMFDPFWNQKCRGYSADEVRVFNRPTGLFCDFASDRRVFTTGEQIKLDFILANFSDAAISEANVEWSLAAAGLSLARGNAPCTAELGIGTARKIGSAKIDVPNVEKPIKATLGCRLGKATDNSYDVWIFPKRSSRNEPTIALDDSFAAALGERYSDTLPATRAAEAKIVIAPYESALAKAALERGQTVITLANQSGKPNVTLGWWSMGSQVGTAFLEHATFKNLPHEGVLNELFFSIMKEGQKLPLADMDGLKMYAVGEGGNDCYLYLGEKNVGTGRLLMNFGLDVLSNTAEGTALLDGIIDYVK